MNEVEENSTPEINNDNKAESGQEELKPKEDDSVNINSVKSEEKVEDIDLVREVVHEHENKVESNIPDESCNGLSGNVITSKNVDLSLKVRSFKDWGYNTFMRTKQKMKEKLSQTSRTVDLDLEDRIEMIRLQQTQYKMMLNNNYRMIEQLKQNILIHQCSSRMFAELAQTDKFLSETFLSQSQSEITAAVFIKDLIDKLMLSTKTLETLVTKTFDDMLFGIEAFEIARVEYDAFKTETVKLVSQIQQRTNANPNDQLKLQDMQERLEQKREKYENSKSNVTVKLDLLDDNKTRVIQREILNFRHAWFMLHSNCLEVYNGSVTKSVEPPADRRET